MKYELTIIAAFSLLLLGATHVLAQGAGNEWDILSQEARELYRAEKYERAVVVAKKALDVTQKSVGRSHPDVATSPNDVVDPEMVVIPAGSFLMGSPQTEKYRTPDEGPQHEVRIPAFAMGKTEVTFQEYDRCTAVGACSGPPRDFGWGRGNRPVINVSWQDAVAYTEWLSKETGNRYRLPTEAEWEYAARAGTTTPYWWGDDTRQDGMVWANCYGCGSQWDGEKTAPSGSFGANPFGLHDTAGNVFEWVQDCYMNSYEDAPADGRAREGPDCGQRVLRGGSWYNTPDGLRSADRYMFFSPDYRFYTIGFRLAQDL